jgi:hypothetical protein
MLLELCSDSKTERTLGLNTSRDAVLVFGALQYDLVHMVFTVLLVGDRDENHSKECDSYLDLLLARWK